MAIEDGRVLAGDFPSRQLKMVQVWIDLHRDELMADWGLVYKHINNETCIMLLHIHPETRSWPCARLNYILPMRIVN